jgi:hypothetical protein
MLDLAECPLHSAILRVLKKERLTSYNPLNFMILILKK